MDMSYTLCVIDMQPHFVATTMQRAKQACAREIRKAIRDKAPILFVEYAHYGPTLPELTDLTKKYHRTYHVTKASNNGGKEVMEFLTQKHLPKLNLRVVGVNTDYCVAQTVQGINSACTNCNIHVIADACDSNANHISGLKYMHSLQRVKVVRHKGTLLMPARPIEIIRVG
jgi:nicotinamidase-related amidase